jgi:hypothetical protein
MTTATTSAVLVPVQPLFTDAERIVLAGYLVGHTLTRRLNATGTHRYAKRLIENCRSRRKEGRSVA